MKTPLELAIDEVESDMGMFKNSYTQIAVSLTEVIAAAKDSIALRAFIESHELTSTYVADTNMNRFWPKKKTNE